MNITKKIIIISHAFPPSTAANGKRPYLIARELLRKGYKVEIVSCYRELTNDYKEILIHDNCKITRIHAPIAELVLKWGNRNKFKKLISLFLKWISWPDFFVVWILRVLKYVKNISYDNLILCIYPRSAIISVLFPKTCNNRWIVDYQESVTPYMRRMPSKSIIKRVLQPYLTKLEKRLLQKVKFVIFSSHSNMRSYINTDLVKKEKTSLLYTPYDKTLFDNSIKPNKKIFTIIYAGSFDKNRSPNIFLKAYRQFLDNVPEARTKSCVSFYGNWNIAYNKILTQQKLESYTKISPSIAYSELLHILQAGSVLLLITSSEHSLFIPGKLSDYFGAKRPVLSFLPPESEVKEILLSTDSAPYICNNESIDDGVRAITKLWLEFKSGKLQHKFSQTPLFSLSDQIEKIINIL